MKTLNVQKGEKRNESFFRKAWALSVYARNSAVVTKSPQNSGSDIHVHCCRSFFKLTLYFSTSPLCDRTLKRLTMFMITIALFKEFGGCDFVTTTEVTNVRRCSSETNKLRYVHSIRVTPGDIAIKDRQVTISKSKLSHLS